MFCIQLAHTYESIISLENLLCAWQEFVKGKRSRKDVQEFELNLMGNISALHRELVLKTYQHGEYQAFNISDPKPRNIHKALVRDRLLHHALYRVLYPFFNDTFIADSFSCRTHKGTHRALNRFRSFAYKESCNNTRTVWVLKCDIRKFFASIDQEILLQILGKYISDENVIWLLNQVIRSFESTGRGKGLPLGNLTSQLLVNIYMNEFDQFVKHILKAKCYIRYADDFVLFSQDKQWLVFVLSQMCSFLSERLVLTMHPDKVSIRTLASGVDFLGWVHFPDHRVLRTTTKKRMMKRLSRGGGAESLQSYLGLLGHGNMRKLQRKLLKQYESYKQNRE